MAVRPHERGGARQRKLSDEQELAVTRMFTETDTPTADIARSFGIGESSVYRVVRRHGARLPRERADHSAAPAASTAVAAAAATPTVAVPEAAAAEPTPRRRATRRTRATSTAVVTAPTRPSRRAVSRGRAALEAGERMSELGQVIGETGLRDVAEGSEMVVHVGPAGSASAASSSYWVKTRSSAVWSSPHSPVRWRRWPSSCRRAEWRPWRDSWREWGAGCAALALSDLSGSSATQALAADIGDVEEDVEVAGAVEMAEGVSELAAGGALEEAGRELEESGEAMLAGSQADPTAGSPRRRRRAASPPVTETAPARGQRRPRGSNTERSGPRSRRRRTE